MLKENGEKKKNDRIEARKKSMKKKWGRFLHVILSFSKIAVRRI